MKFIKSDQQSVLLAHQMSAFAAGVRKLQSTEDFVEERKYSAAEMERILKIQEVISKAMAGKPSRLWIDKDRFQFSVVA